MWRLRIAARHFLVFIVAAGATLMLAGWLDRAISGEQARHRDLLDARRYVPDVDSLLARVDRLDATARLLVSTPIPSPTDTFFREEEILDARLAREIEESPTAECRRALTLAHHHLQFLETAAILAQTSRLTGDQLATFDVGADRSLAKVHEEWAAMRRSDDRVVGGSLRRSSGSIGRARRALRFGTGAIVALFVLALGISHSGLRRERLAAERASRELRRLEETLRHLPVAVQVSDASTGTVILANDEARRLLGPDAHVILGRVAGRLRRADGRPVSLEESPVARASRGEAVPLQEFELVTSRGEPLSLLAAAHRVSDDRAPLVQTAFLDITDRRRLEQFHERAIAIVGHDLRGPLAAIETAARMLDESARDVDTRRLAERISRSAHHMASMVAELLDFSRARLARGIPIEPRRASLCAIVGDAVEELRPLAGGRIIEFEGPETLDGFFDPTRLAQAVGNIVRNAIEHGRSRVSVTVRKEGDAGVIRISNDNRAGPIPALLLPHLFEPFHRGAEPGPGLGLGLYIANEVILGHGGTLEVESTETATTFTARLPLSGPAALNARE